MPKSSEALTCWCAKDPHFGKVYITLKYTVDVPPQSIKKGRPITRKTWLVTLGSEPFEYKPDCDSVVFKRYVISNEETRVELIQHALSNQMFAMFGINVYKTDGFKITETKKRIEETKLVASVPSKNLNRGRDTYTWKLNQ